ncbi:MAG TPA: ATP-binding protein [Chryseolinea sp.]|nr:ATP-binding protein [Chryseolinea sp.]HPM29591.1 ATP-binding protein [Chryseolinea sp.]
MKRSLYNIAPKNQYLLSVGLVLCVTGLGLALHGLVGYRVVAFMLLVTVSILAMFLDIVPVILAAFLSALFWDLLFIPPRFTFTVGTVEDRWLLLMYFVIALIHAVLTFKIRQMESEVRTKEEKARAIKFYNTVFNSLSHELRTPITTVIGATDNLLSDNAKISEADKRELLSEISIAAMRLNRQVENLLSMSRLESGVIQVKKDWVDVRELIYTTLKEFESNTTKYRVNISAPDTLPLFKLDFGLMEQVLHNLISNAIQHTAEGTDITIHADVLDEKLFLTVSDTGKGFPEAEKDKVFDKFYRVTGSRAGGTGLGLSIVRGFVEAHHGTISLRNLPLSGAEFAIEIPTETTYVNRLKNE